MSQGPEAEKSTEFWGKRGHLGWLEHKALEEKGCREPPRLGGGALPPISMERRLSLGGHSRRGEGSLSPLQKEGGSRMGRLG